MHLLIAHSDGILSEIEESTLHVLEVLDEKRDVVATVALGGVERVSLLHADESQNKKSAETPAEDETGEDGDSGDAGDQPATVPRRGRKR